VLVWAFVFASGRPKVHSIDETPSATPHRYRKPCNVPVCGIKNSQGKIMKNAYASSIVLALSALAAGQAFADNGQPRYDQTIGVNPPTAFASSKTVQQVRIELAEAQRTGDILANRGGGDSTAKLNQLYPGRYPAQSVAPGKTFEQVRLELAEAQRTGDILANRGGGDSTVKLNQLNPSRYPA